MFAGSRNKLNKLCMDYLGALKKNNILERQAKISNILRLDYD